MKLQVPLPRLLRFNRLPLASGELRYVFDGGFFVLRGVFGVRRRLLELGARFGAVVWVGGEVCV
jgi:hypothetical protein